MTETVVDIEEIVDYVRDAYEHELLPEQTIVIVGVVYNPAGSEDVLYTATLRTDDDLSYWKVDYYHDDYVSIAKFEQVSKLAMSFQEEEIHA